VEGARISEVVAQKLGRVFTVLPDDVVSDANRSATWHGPADDLLVALEQRHDWNAERALRYLVSVRSALAGELDQS